jgi:hypothetical protein
VSKSAQRSQRSPNQKRRFTSYWSIIIRPSPTEIGPNTKVFLLTRATLTTVWQTDSSSNPDIFTSTIDEFLDQTKDGPDSQPVFEEKMVESEIVVKQNLANAWVKYDAKFGSEDNLMTWSGYDLFSLIKHEGEWKIASIVYSSAED